MCSQAHYKILLLHKKKVDKWLANQWELDLAGRTSKSFLAAVIPFLYESEAMPSGSQPGAM